MLEERYQTIKAERDANERLVADLRENVSADQIELARLNTLLESEKSKVSGQHWQVVGWVAMHPCSCTDQTELVSLFFAAPL